MDILLSNIVKYVKDYKLSNDERTLFDWLVLKQHDFGVGKTFRHSIPQVESATLVKRWTQEKTFQHFSDLGFLTVDTEFYQNNPYRSFYVDFSILIIPEVLGSIVREGSETYANLLTLFSEWADEQSKAMERPAITERKSAEEENQAVDELYKMLNGVWIDRIKKFNSGWLTGEEPDHKKSPASLSYGKNTMRILGKVRLIYDDKSIKYAFTAFVDSILKKEVNVDRNILLYFLKNNEGDYIVVNKNLDIFNAQYSQRSN